MENRYLFRGKRTDNNEWEYGLPSYDEDGEIEEIEVWSEDDINFYSVDPSTICQCIGIEDKNGKLIFENDIVRIVYDGIEHIYIIKWDVDELDFKATNGKENYGSNFQYLGCCEEVEIIGNFFDNPELLEV